MTTTATERVTAGLSTERLRRLDGHIEREYLETGKLPGALVLVARRGEIVHLSTLGQMDEERRKPVREDTIFRIYSMSKPITSVALMSLFEEGRFQLDDPVHEYIPEWADLEVWVSGAHPTFLTRPTERPMTVRDLLTHQSGLTYDFQFRNSVDAAYRELNIVRTPAAPGSPWTDTLAGTAAKLARLPLVFSPGAAWNYSVSTDMCGYLVEVISGKTFDQFLEERVTGPLGMTDTAFRVPDEKLERFAACYAPSPRGGHEIQDDPETSDYRRPPTLLSGGAGLVSTAHDYFRFGQMLLNGGELDGERILGRKTVELMRLNHLRDGLDLAALAPEGPTATPGIGFGLGFSVVLDNSLAQISGSPGHFAWAGAASTAFWVDPVEEVVFVFMTQMLMPAYPSLRGELQVLVNSAIVD